MATAAACKKDQTAESTSPADMQDTSPAVQADADTGAAHAEDAEADAADDTAGEVADTDPGDATADDTAADDPLGPRHAAVVKVEIKQEDGEVVEHVGAPIDLGEDQKVEFTAGGHKHVFMFEVTPKDPKARKLTVRFSYVRDGVDFFRGFDYDTKARKRELIRPDDESIVLALTVSPKIIYPETTTREEEDQVEKAKDTKDPIGGIKKR
jgi:hypothetical protein